MDEEVRKEIEDFIEKYHDKAVWQIDPLLVKFVEELLKKKKPARIW